MRHTLATVLGSAFVLFPAAVSASTLPRVDFHQEQRALALGILDASFDYALTDQLSIGATLNPSVMTFRWYDPVLSPFAAAVRSTYRLGGRPEGFSYGITLSGGVVMQPVVTDCGPDCHPYDLSMGLPYLLDRQYLAFVQPALNATLPLGERLKIRATLGPLLILNGAFGLEPRVLPIPWPNLELAIAMGRDQELTLLGNSLVGWRGMF